MTDDEKCSQTDCSLWLLGNEFRGCTAQSRLVVHCNIHMVQICNMINTPKRTPFFTFLMLPPHQCCSQAGCTYRNIIVGNQFLLTEFKRTCRPLMILSLSSVHFVIFLSISISHTHTIIDRSTRQNADWMWFVSLSLSYHTHIKSTRISHASQQCCKWPRIWFAAVEVFRGIRCYLNKEAT